MSALQVSGGNSTIIFDSYTENSGILSIWNWGGTVGSTGGNDQLIFDTDWLSGTTSNVDFYSDNGTVFLGKGVIFDIGDGLWELAPVPESSTWIVGCGIVIVMVTQGYLRIRRKRA